MSGSRETGFRANKTFRECRTNSNYANSAASLQNFSKKTSGKIYSSLIPSFFVALPTSTVEIQTLRKI